MPSASDLSRRLAQHAEAVCRRYLSKGRRDGRYWFVGNTANTAGRSLYVRLYGPQGGRGAAGRWRDAATGEHGDLLDLIGAVEGHASLAETLLEARRFLSLPAVALALPPAPAPPGSPLAAQRLFAMAKPARGTLAEVYLRDRRITATLPSRSIRFHPRCWYRPKEGEAAARLAWPALIAAVTDLEGAITGVMRTWLDPAGGKATVASPRRALGSLHGHGVRFGTLREVLVVGEGLETLLSIRSAFPRLPGVAALSATHLAELRLPGSLRRLYIAQDNDEAGRKAASRLATRASEAGIEVAVLAPERGDFNEDLQAVGVHSIRTRLTDQLFAADGGLLQL